MEDCLDWVYLVNQATLGFTSIQLPILALYVSSSVSHLNSLGDRSGLTFSELGELGKFFLVHPSCRKSAVGCCVTGDKSLGFVFGNLEFEPLDYSAIV